MKKKLFRIMIVICMIVTFIPIPAQAQEAVATVSNTSDGSLVSSYANFADAVVNWTENTTLTLLDNVSYDQTITVTGTGMILDLNGNDLNFTINNAITVQGDGSHLTVRDSGTGGSINLSGNSECINVKGGGTFVLKSGIINKNITVFSYSTAEIRGGNINHAYLIVNGTDANGIITGGEITSISARKGNITIDEFPTIGKSSFYELYGMWIGADATVTISGEPTFRKALYVASTITLNTQPAPGTTWSIDVATGQDSAIENNVFAVPGEDLDGELDPSRFVAAEGGYRVKKLDDGSLSIIVCDHAGYEQIWTVYPDDFYCHWKVWPCCNLADSRTISEHDDEFFDIGYCSICDSTCGVTFDHEFRSGECQLCYYVCPHSGTAIEYSPAVGDLTKHKITCLCGEADGLEIHTYDTNGSCICGAENIPPEGTITIRNSTWDEFSNWSDFEYFFKNTIEVSLVADGTGSEVAKLEYLFSEAPLAEGTLPSTGWTEVTGDTFSVNPQNKGAVYVRITDAYGNVTIINSGGIVVYSDAQADTENVNATYKADVDQDVSVTLNGNSIKSVSNGTTVLTADTDYTVSDGTITLKGTYIKTLEAGTYTFIVSYNPLGETYVEADGNDLPADTTFTLIIRQLSSGGFSFAYVEPPQKPIIEAEEGVSVQLSENGKTADITVAEGYELESILVNGKSVGKVTRLTGLKTGDKVEILTEKVSTVEELLKGQVDDIKLVARSKNVKMANGKKAVKIYWLDENGKEIEFDGVEIFRSDKRYSGYGNKPIFVSKTDKYYNVAIKAGKKYYYKVRGYVVIGGEKYYTEWSKKAIRTVSK